ncbi:hypothetical protein [Thalassotalea castellviae]|uniref:DUF4178 domain-containing protein n=1 Tax=Thalassotalea castellviae TaxID=3075612 RepID=A0ABU2ZWP9_9GAMM|nr:hypothetical protein [Thalassotalea sp. W431]MDT0602346.1 hypothetical protein [Thalassotalea sp. W431]
MIELLTIVLIVFVCYMFVKKQNKKNPNIIKTTVPDISPPEIEKPKFLDGRDIPAECLDSYEKKGGFHYIRKVNKEHLFWDDSVEITCTDDGEWFCVEWITTQYQPEAIFDGERVWTNKCSSRESMDYLNLLVKYSSNSDLNLGVYDSKDIKKLVDEKDGAIYSDPKIPRKMEIEILENVISNFEGHTYHFPPGFYDTKVRLHDANSGDVSELQILGNVEGKMDQSKYDELVNNNKLKILNVISLN